MALIHGQDTLPKLFRHVVRERGDAVAMREKHLGIWRAITWREYGARARAVGSGLVALGLRPRDVVSIIAENGPEWLYTDLGTMSVAGVTNGIYTTDSPRQVEYIVNDSGSRFFFAENEEQLDKILEVRGRCPQLVKIVVYDMDGLHAFRDDQVLSFEALLELGAQWDREHPGAFDALVETPRPEDLAILVYTSGTTGPPKGVELTHANMLAQWRALQATRPRPSGGRLISFLPAAHIADRWSSHYNQMVFGIQVTSVSDPRAVAAVLPEVRPTVWGAVPRVVEKLKAALDAAIAADPDAQRREATRAAIDLGIHRVRLEQAGEPVPDEIAAQHAVAEERVLSRLRARLGLDQAEWILIGAAPLARDVHEFLLGLGLPVAELYGMSECSCVVTACPPGEVRLGSVGRALPGVELRVAGDGELLVRGPVVMRGYRGHPEQTAEAIDAEGWMHTGDIATIDADGHVRIVDRKKELIINAAGKNMSPANIEGQLKAASPLIGQCVVIGDARPYNVALLVLDPDAAAAHARAHGLADSSVEAVAADPEVRRLVDGAVERANGRLSRVEQIKRYALLAEEWLPGGDELTPTMKLKRKPIAAKHAATIDALYAG